jgi:hypothetical protein
MQKNEAPAMCALRFSLSKKSLGLLRAAALNPVFRLRRFIRRNGSPGTGDCSVFFAARESEGREAKNGCPVKKLVF